MSNEYFVPPSQVPAGSRARALQINDLSDATDAGFDNIPAGLAGTIAALVAGSGTSVSTADTSIGNLDVKLIATGTFTVAKTSSPYTVTAADLKPIQFTINNPGSDESYSIVSDVTFTNNGASGEVDFQLPDVNLHSGGDRKSFRVVAAQYLKVTANGTDKIRFRSSTSAAGGHIRSNEVGTCFTVELLGGEWVVTHLVGVLDVDGTSEWHAVSPVTFPATAVPSADPNTLDDYEEGTWAVGLDFGGGDSGITYGTQAGYYTKIGRQVTVTGRLVLTNKGASTGVARINSMPFLVSNNVGMDSGMNIGYTSNITFADMMTGLVTINTITIEFFETTTGGTATALTDADFANTSAMNFSAIYFV